MNRAIIIFSLLIFLFSLSYSYENGMLNMMVPTNLEKGNLELSIRHRFYGRIDEDTFDTFFGLDKGVNVNLGIRFPLVTNLETHLNYIRLNSEYSMGISYKKTFPKLYLNSQAYIEYFTFKKIGFDKRRNNFFYQISFQPKPLKSVFTPIINFAFDGYYDRIGIATGLSIKAFENWNLITEFYPILNQDKDLKGKIPIGDKYFFAFGIKYKTYAHHFVFVISNGSQIGNRNIILGTTSNDLFFGFNVQRKLYL